MAKASEKYEVMYIINPNFTEEETAAVVEKFKALVEANGTLAVSYTHLTLPTN